MLECDFFFFLSLKDFIKLNLSLPSMRSAQVGSKNTRVQTVELYAQKKRKTQTGLQGRIHARKRIKS